MFTDECMDVYPCSTCVWIVTLLASVLMQWHGAKNEIKYSLSYLNDKTPSLYHEQVKTLLTFSEGVFEEFSASESFRAELFKPMQSDR